MEMNFIHAEKGNQFKGRFVYNSFPHQNSTIKIENGCFNDCPKVQTFE